MTNPTRTEVIKQFLINKTHQDLAALYNHDLEVQVNVAQDGGDRIESEYQGRGWHGWTDGIQTWKSFRIPYKTGEYEDKPMSFDLEAHVEGIGLTGWDWVNKVSKWVAFDFDAIIGHSEHHDKKLTDSTLKEIQQQVANVPWVTLRHSTSGNGLHLYVFLSNVFTANHTEHAALARAVLGSLSAVTGYDLKSKVDACGGNIWIWHRKMQGRGLLLIKKGDILKDIPINWKDHVRVISGKRNKILPNFVETTDTEQLFEELAGQRNRIPLDDEHKKLIDFLQDSGFIWYWDNDHHMLVTHAYALKLAHQALGMRGVYNTISPGSDPSEQNCFNGETEVITKDGVFTLAELVNQDVELYVKTDKGFEWVKSRIACFGEQTTFPITFGDDHTVRTTYNHEWLVYRNKQITRVLTYDLKENRDYAVLCNRKLPIRKDQKKKFIKRENHFTTTITKIDYTDLKNELVYCAIVPRWHNFTLANGVVTGNCFCSPKRRGAWSVRRFTLGVQEADTWEQDRNGYTHCYLNQQADLRTAAKSVGGVEDTDGGFIFREAEVANQAANLLGVDFNLPSWIASGRQTKLKEHKDGRLVVEIKHEDHDVVTPEMSTWLIKKGLWQKIYNVRMGTPLEPETDNYDDVVRHLVTETGADHGWVIKNEESWVEEPYVHVKAFLQSLGMIQKEVIQVMGSCISKHWRLVNRPFQDEYIGDRQWNRNAAQLRYAPSDSSDALNHPSWDIILNHVGQGLNSIIVEHPWAKLNHVMTGADYLKCWLASLFKEPLEPLPYLFLWGPQNSGKSIFHEAIELLITAGVVRADTALISQSGFNAELANAVLCIIEETDLQKSKVAYNRLKDWVVSRNISIHRKGSTPYMLRNSTHWLQCLPESSIILTTEGPQSIKQLKNRKMISIISNGSIYKTTAPFKTGTKEIYKISTEEGYELFATDNHLVLLDFDNLKTWVETKDLKPGHKITISEHLNFKWPGKGTKEEGYLLGQIVGDGTISNNKWHHAKILLCSEGTHLFETILSYLVNKPSIFFREVDGTETIIITGPELNFLTLNCQIHNNKNIRPLLIGYSSDFISGFLGGFFDTDGTVDQKGYRIAYCQSNYERLQIVQQLLLYFGIVSSIKKGYHGRGKKGKTQKQKYILMISKDNVQRFNSRIFYHHQYKKEKIEKIIPRQAHYAARKEKFLSTVKSVKLHSTEMTYDLTVPVIHEFCANGFRVHNCSNDLSACPVFPGDSRITMLYVPNLEKQIPKKILLPALEKEAPDFLSSLINLELPYSDDRLNVPVIITQDKIDAQAANRTLLEEWLDDHVYYTPGYWTKYSDLFEAFKEWLPPDEIHQWSIIRFGKELPKHKFPKGRSVADAQWHIGNISLIPKEPNGKVYKLTGDKLILVEKGPKNV